MSDPYDHDLKQEWGEFKRLAHIVETARMVRTSRDDGYLIPCVQVYVYDDVGEDGMKELREKAETLGLVEVEEDEVHQEKNKYTFVSEDRLQ